LSNKNNFDFFQRSLNKRVVSRKLPIGLCCFPGMRPPLAVIRFGHFGANKFIDDKNVK
jgi:hypothetical protein